MRNEDERRTYLSRQAQIKKSYKTLGIKPSMWYNIIVVVVLFNAVV